MIHIFHQEKEYIQSGLIGYMGTDLPNYTTINVYPEDRDRAKAAKFDNETWSDFIRRAGEELEK